LGRRTARAQRIRKATRYQRRKSLDAAALRQATPHQILALLEPHLANPNELPPDDRGLPLYIALPIIFALGLGMWAVIGKLVYFAVHLVMTLANL